MYDCLQLYGTFRSTFCTLEYKRRGARSHDFGAESDARGGPALDYLQLLVLSIVFCTFIDHKYFYQ